MLAEKTGLKTILRTPFKSILFLILLAVLTVMLSIVLCVYNAVNDYLTECDVYYHSIAEVEYLGDEYPNQQVNDTNLALAVKENRTVFEQLRNLDGVIAFDAEKAYLGVIEGKSRNDKYIYDREAAVLRVRIMMYDERSNGYIGIINKPLFSREDTTDKMVFMSTDGELKKSTNYIMCGHYIDGPSGYLWFVPEDMNVIHNGEEIVCRSFTELEGEDVPEGSEYLTLARVLSVHKDGYRVHPVIDLENLRPWQQGELKIDTGRMFTAEEYASDAHVCVVPDLLLAQSELELGDTFNMSVNDYPGGMYSDFTGTIEPYSDYTIVGTYVRTADYPDTVFVPASNINSEITAVTGYVLGQFRLENEKAAQFTMKAKELLPPMFKINMYDEGYSVVSGPYRELSELSVIFLIICLIVIAAVLGFFSYLFILRRRDVAQLQLALGSGKLHVIRTFVTSAFVIGIPAIALGAAVGVNLENRVLGFIGGLITKFMDKDNRFSSARITVVRELPFSPASDITVYERTAFILMVGLLVFTTLFAVAAIKEKKTKKKKKRKAIHHTSGAKTSRLSGRLKFSWLSLMRGGIRSVTVVLLCAAVAVFIGQLTSTEDVYRDQFAKIEAETVIKGYATDHAGKYIDGMVVQAEKVQQLYDSGLLDKVTITRQPSYLMFVGVSRLADGTDTGLEHPEIPTNGFAQETMFNKISKEPKWYATNSLIGSPQFYFENNPSVSWLKGFSDDSFKGPYPDVCALPVNMMERGGIKLGDTVRFLASTKAGSRGLLFEELEFLVIAEYEIPSGGETIYTPIGYTFPQGSEVPEGVERDVINASRWWAFGYDATLEPEIFSFITYRSMIFTLKSTADLDAVREVMADIPFSQTGVLDRVRSFAVIDDADYIIQIEGLERQIRYMDALYIFLYVLTMIVGIVAAYLMLNSRISEMAIMRALGTAPWQVVLTFTVEQLVLSIAGIVIGFFIRKFTGSHVNATYFEMLGYFGASWMIGTLIRIGKGFTIKTRDLLE